MSDRIFSDGFVFKNGSDGSNILDIFCWEDGRYRDTAWDSPTGLILSAKVYLVPPDKQIWQWTIPNDFPSFFNLPTYRSFWRISHGFIDISRFFWRISPWIFLRCSHSNHHGKSYYNHGFPMIFPWFSYDFPMVFLWFSYDFPMIFLWFSHSNHPQSPIQIGDLAAGRSGGSRDHAGGHEIWPLAVSLCEPWDPQDPREVSPLGMGKTWEKHGKNIGKWDFCGKW